MFFHLNAATASRLLVKGKRLVNPELQELNRAVERSGLKIDGLEGIFVTFVDQDKSSLSETVEDNVLHIELGFDNDDFSHRRDIEFIKPFVVERLRYAVTRSKSLEVVRAQLLTMIDSVFER